MQAVLIAVMKRFATACKRERIWRPYTKEFHDELAQKKAIDKKSALKEIRTGYRSNV